MADMFDYLSWRGDIPFSAMGPNPVDSLILSTLIYIDFGAAVPHTPHAQISLEDAAIAVLADPDAPNKVRVDQDLELLAAAAATERFRNIGLSFYRDVFIPEEDTQFAAMTFFLGDGSAYLIFRGTDNTLVGWKEDFNMTFLDHIPAQKLASEYLRELAAAFSGPLHLAGHSKGGNLAFYAAAMGGESIQDRVCDICNLDGPGFMSHVIEHPGYRRILPRVHTYMPQSSIFGMLLEHLEPHTVIQARAVGLLQHDPYNWEVYGPGFIPDEPSADSLFMERTLTVWLAGMNMDQRNEFFDAFFGLLMTDNTINTKDMLRPQTLLAYARNLITNETIRTLLITELENLIHSAKLATGGKNHE